MTFPVHRSDEATATARGTAFGRAMATQVQHTVAVYTRMFAERNATVPPSLPAHPEIDAIAKAANVEPHMLRAINARTEILKRRRRVLRPGRRRSARAELGLAPGELAHVELSPGGANVIKPQQGAHTNHFLVLPRRGTDIMATDSPTTHERLSVVRAQPLLDALRDHGGHPRGVCRHTDRNDAWIDQTTTIASVVMNLKARRLHVAAGPPCSHEHEEINLPTRTASDRLATTAAR